MPGADRCLCGAEGGVRRRRGGADRRARGRATSGKDQSSLTTRSDQMHCRVTVGGQPVRISSMVLLVAYAFYYKNVFSIIIYHHMPRERRCLRHSGAQQSHLPAEFLSNRRPRRRGMATSSPLHSGGSTSRQPSSHSQHGITASNAALPSRKVEGLLDPLRPWSGSRSCGGPPRPRPLPFARASRVSRRTSLPGGGGHLSPRPPPP